MPIKVTCPKCGGVLHAPDDSAGKRGRCPTCTTVLTIPAANAAASSDLPPAQSPGSPATAGGGLARTPGGGLRPGLMETTDVSPPPGRNLPPVPESRPAPGTYTFQEPEPRPAIPSRLPPPAAPVPGPRLPEPGRQTFTPSATATDDEPQERKVRGWKRVRRGLGLIRCAALFAFLAPAAFAGLLAYEQYGSPLPQKPGLLKIENVELAQEIRIAAVAVPVLLSVLCTLFGRISMVGAPRMSMARGLLRFSALATAFAIAGLVIAAFPTVVEFMDGAEPNGFLPPESQSGAFQRFGLAAGLALSLVAEFWFLAAVSKIGVALQHRPTAGRSGGLMILTGLLLVLGTVAAVGCLEYAGFIQQYWNTQAAVQWDKLGIHKPIARAGVAVLVGFIVAALYLRLVGAGRRATRDWLERNAPA